MLNTGEEPAVKKEWQVVDNEGYLHALSNRVPLHKPQLLLCELREVLWLHLLIGTHFSLGILPDFIAFILTILSYPWRRSVFPKLQPHVVASFLI